VTARNDCRDLYLVRHAFAAHADPARWPDDAVRPLTEEGIDRFRAAARGLGRMQHWQAASQLAEGLRDSAWHVRRDAGLALRSIGAPGALFLRRSLNSDDRFAADMAQLVLDLPEAAAAG